MTFSAQHIKTARLHLRKSDPTLAAIIKQVGPFTAKARRDRLASLVRAIISQQISTKAAATIFERFKAAVKENRLTPPKRGAAFCATTILSFSSEGVVCQLVLSTIGRLGCPVLRYVTGDLVRPTWQKNSAFVFLEGGVIGRADDMLIIRGVNVFPTALEKILRGFDEVDEFQLIAWKDGQMDQLKVRVEDHLNQPQRIADEIQLRLGLRVEVEVVESGSLPRFEMKGKRFLDQR